jgi:hypothetical protein
VSIANSISKNSKKSDLEFLHQNFHQKNKNKKTRNASVLSTENCKSFFLFFLYFQYFKYFRRLGDRLVLRFISSKKEFFRVKKEFFRVKKEFFRVKKEFFFCIFFY